MNNLELSAKEFKILHEIMELSIKELKIIHEIMEELETDTKRDFKDEDSNHSLCAKVSAPFVPNDEKAELIKNVFGITEEDDMFSDLYRAMSDYDD